MDRASRWLANFIQLPKAHITMPAIPSAIPIMMMITNNALSALVVAPIAVP